MRSAAIIALSSLWFREFFNCTVFISHFINFKFRQNLIKIYIRYFSMTVNKLIVFDFTRPGCTSLCSYSISIR